MQDWQELIIEGVLGLAIYLIGIRSLREVLRGALRRRWGPLAIEVATFVLLLVTVICFRVPAFAELGDFGVVAGVLAVLTVVAVSALLQEYGTDSKIDLWFEESTSYALDLLTSDRNMNTRALRRFSRILRSYGHVRTTSIRDTLRYHDDPQTGSFLLYDITRVKELEIGDAAPKRVDIVIEVRPSVTPARGGEWSYPALPLRPERPEDKWQQSFWLPVLSESLDFWDHHIGSMEVKGQLLSKSGDSTDLSFDKALRPRLVSVGEEHFETRYVEFRTTIPLTAQSHLTLRYQVQNLIHSLDALSMYWLPFDVCLGTWEFQVSNVPSSHLRLCGMYPICSLGDVAIPQREIQDDFGRVTLEALPDSLIMPQDAVLLMFSPFVSQSDTEPPQAGVGS